jgi:hypothetical protein
MPLKVEKNPLGLVLWFRGSKDQKLLALFGSKSEMVAVPIFFFLAARTSQVMTSGVNWYFMYTFLETFRLVSSPNSRPQPVQQVGKTLQHNWRRIPIRSQLS